jgi:uncharacterized protein
MTRAVADTNILIRAVITPRGAIAPILARMHEGKVTLVYSQTILEELVEKLALPRIANKYHLTEEVIKNFVAVLIRYGERVEPDRKVDICRDPEDNMVIEAALAGDAEFVITGDEDLLVLQQYETVSFLTPGQFLAIFDQRENP